MNEAIAEVLSRTRGHLPDLRPIDQNKSVFADRLLSLWAWGLVSATNVQWLAEGVVMDKGVSQQCMDLANIGSRGAQPGNCRRDLLRKLPEKGKCEPMIVHAVPLQINTKIVFCDQCIVSPVRVVDMFFRDFPSRFRETFGIAKLPEFWSSLDPNDPKLRSHPMLDKPDWQRRAIPIVIHGDGGQYTKSNNNSLMVTSWKPLLNESFDSGIFLLFALPKSVKASIHSSHKALWASVVFLFNALFVGALPHADHNGRRWAQGSAEAYMAEREQLFGSYFFVVWSLTGDLPYLSEEYKLPHFNGNAFCWFCGANRSDATFTDTSGNARWRSLQIQCRPGLPRISDHPIWELLGVQRWHSVGDLMHTGCLGVLQWLLGAVLWELVFDGPFRGTIETRRQAVWELIGEKYVELGVPAGNRLPDIDVERFRHTDSFAELRAKAAWSRHLLPVMCAVCAHVYDGSDRDRHRLAALYHCNAIYEIVESAGWRFDADEETRSAWHVDEFLLHYHWLTARALDNGRMLYHFTTKFHFFWHIVTLGKYLNPKLTWCYGFESFIGRIVQCARACVAGTPPHSIGHKVATFFLVWLRLELGKN